MSKSPNPEENKERKEVKWITKTVIKLSKVTYFFHGYAEGFMSIIYYYFLFFDIKKDEEVFLFGYGINGNFF